MNEIIRIGHRGGIWPSKMAFPKIQWSTMSALAFLLPFDVALAVAFITSKLKGVFSIVCSLPQSK
jgi:hypothetical protein